MKRLSFLAVKQCIVVSLRFCALAHVTVVGVVAAAQGVKAEYVESAFASSRVFEVNNRLRVFNAQVGVGRTLLSGSQRMIAHNVSAATTKRKETSREETWFRFAMRAFSRRRYEIAAKHFFNLAESSRGKHEPDLYPYSLWRENYANALEYDLIDQTAFLSRGAAIELLRDIRDTYVELSGIAVDDPLRRAEGYYSQKIEICESALEAARSSSTSKEFLTEASRKLRGVHQLEAASRDQRFGKELEKTNPQMAAIHYADSAEQFLSERKYEEAKTLSLKSIELATQTRHFGVAARCYLYLTQIARHTSGPPDVFRLYARSLDSHLIYEGSGLGRAEFIKLLSLLPKVHVDTGRILSRDPLQRNEALKHYRKARYFQELLASELGSSARGDGQTEEERAKMLTAVAEEMERLDFQAMEDSE